MALKNVDSQKIALYGRTLPYALVAAGIGVGPMLMAGVKVPIIILVSVLAFFVGLFLPVMLSERAADAGASIYTASGSSTPALAQYSLAESLVARGQTDEAIEAYTLLSEDFPQDPQPRIRLARVLRDKKQDYEGAAEWFRKSLACEKMEQANEIAIIREMVEVYTHKMNTPELALRYLPRLYEKYPTHPAAEWARREYLEIKEALQSRG